MPTCISWCSNRLKNGPYPNCQLRLICFIRANVVKIIKKQSNPTQCIQYKANIKIFSLARNILVVDGHFSVFPSIRINLGSFFRMEHRAHQNPHCRFIFLVKKLLPIAKVNKRGNMIFSVCNDERVLQIFIYNVQKQKSL